MRPIVDIFKKISDFEIFYIVRDSNGQILYSFPNLEDMEPVLPAPKVENPTFFQYCNKKNGERYEVKKITIDNFIIERWNNKTEELRQQQNLSDKDVTITKLEIENMHDELTSLINRRRVISILKQIINDEANKHKPLTIAVCDIDKFKNINDKYGHSSGDRVLRQFSNILLSKAEEDGFIASRYAGDEFLLVYLGVDFEAACQSLNGIRQTINALSFDSAKGSFSTSVSTGGQQIYLTNQSFEDIEQIIDQADEAMYSSKANGGNMVTLINPATKVFEAYDATFIEKTLNKK